MKIDRSKLKATGMVAAAVAVIGITIIIGNSSVTDLTKGVSADLEDLATGNVTVMSREAYDSALAKLNEYFQRPDNRTAQDNIIREVVNILQDVQR